MGDVGIRTVRDYVDSDGEDSSLCFKSGCGAINSNAVESYTIHAKPPKGAREGSLCIRPVGDKPFEPVSVLLRQHLDDEVV